MLLAVVVPVLSTDNKIYNMWIKMLAVVWFLTNAQIVQEQKNSMPNQTQELIGRTKTKIYFQGNI